MAGTHEGSLKAAKTIEKERPGFHKEIGSKGAEARHNISAKKESEIAQKAARTRKANDPEAFKKMGEKGGKAKREAPKEEE